MEKPRFTNDELAAIWAVANALQDISRVNWKQLDRQRQLLLLAAYLQTSSIHDRAPGGWLIKPTPDILWEVLGLEKGGSQSGFRSSMAVSPLFEVNGLHSKNSRHRVVVTPLLDAVLARHKELLEKPENAVGKDGVPSQATLSTTLVPIEAQQSTEEFQDPLVQFLVNYIETRLDGDSVRMRLVGEELIKRAKR